MTAANPLRLLVTGATGFIGSRLVCRLRENGIAVFPFSRSLGHDVTAPSSYDPFRKSGITHVIHLAGRTFVPDSWAFPDRFYETNTLGTQHVLDFCRESGARLVYVSAYIYGIPESLPIREDHRAAPNNPYAHSKWLGEELCRFYADQYNVPVTVLRPFNLYGPGQGEQFLIPTILTQARSTEVIVVKDAAPKRDYLHLDDFIRACIACLGIKERFSLFNVGSGCSVSVGELLEMAVQYSPKPLRWSSTGEIRVNEIPDTVADISAITAALGWHPEISLEEYIRAELA